MSHLLDLLSLVKSLFLVHVRGRSGRHVWYQGEGSIGGTRVNSRNGKCVSVYIHKIYLSILNEKGKVSSIRSLESCESSLNKKNY